MFALRNRSVDAVNTLLSLKADINLRVITPLLQIPRMRLLPRYAQVGVSDLWKGQKERMRVFALERERAR